MDFDGINYLAILVAAVVAWIVGAVWYTVLSGPWMAAIGKTRESVKADQEASGLPMWFPFVLSFVAELVMAFVLAVLMFQPNVGPPTIGGGLLWGAFVWLGFVLTTGAVNNAYPSRKPALTVIDAGHWLLVLLAMGLVLAWMG
jgi:hypothetical protein